MLGRREARKDSCVRATSVVEKQRQNKGLGEKELEFISGKWTCREGGESCTG